jgi:hypothetical protein
MRGIVCLFVTLIAVPTLADGSTRQTGGAQDKATKPAVAPKVDEAKLVEVVPDLPDFPSAVMVSSEEKGPNEGWTHSWKRETRTTASFGDVKKFYLGQFEKKGWRVTATKEKSGKAEFALTKGPSWGQVKVDGGSAAIVKITAEWKTR